LLRTINSGQIAQAEAVRNRTQNLDVKQYADRAITDHKAALDREYSVGARISIVIRENDDVRQLARTSTDTVAWLQGLRGPALDTGYMDTQVLMHEMALQLLADRSLPTPMRPEMANEVQLLRKTEQMHLDEARRIRDLLQATHAVPASAPNGVRSGR
jgi:predicted outer membrane protein